MLYELLPVKSVSQERLRIRIRQQYVAYLWEENRVLSQTTCDMLFGAGYATAAWWILGVTMIAISYVNRKGE